MTPDDLRSARRTLGLTCQALAEALGVNERTIRRWEKGKCRIPGAALLVITGWLKRATR